MTIYIALPITGRGYDEVVKDIEYKKTTLEGYGYDVIHPMTGKAYLRNETQLKSQGMDNPVSTNHAIFERDMFMVKKCDVILVDFTNAGPQATGMTMELAWASLLGKHSIVIMKKTNPHYHAFIIEAADIIFPSLLDALGYLEKLKQGTM